MKLSEDTRSRIRPVTDDPVQTWKDARDAANAPIPPTSVELSGVEFQSMGFIAHGGGVHRGSPSLRSRLQANGAYRLSLFAALICLAVTCIVCGSILASTARLERMQKEQRTIEQGVRP